MTCSIAIAGDARSWPASPEVTMLPARSTIAISDDEIPHRHLQRGPQRERGSKNRHACRHDVHVRHAPRFTERSGELRGCCF